jgi:hypothetical protein
MPGQGALPPLPEPDYQAEFQGQQEQAPDDFFSRLAMGSGPEPFSFRPRPQPTGLEVLLSILSSVGNYKAAKASRNISQVDQRNQRARESAKELARHRWELRKEDRARVAAMTEAGARRAERREYRTEADNRYANETVLVDTPQGPKRSRINTVPGQVVAGMRDTPKDVESTRRADAARRAAATATRAATTDSTRAATSAAKGAAKDFTIRKRAVLGDIRALDRMGGDRKERAKASIDAYLKENPDLDNDTEVYRALLRRFPIKPAAAR